MIMHSYKLIVLKITISGLLEITIAIIYTPRVGSQIGRNLSGEEEGSQFRGEVNSQQENFLWRTLKMRGASAPQPPLSATYATYSYGLKLRTFYTSRWVHQPGTKTGDSEVAQGATVVSFISTGYLQQRPQLYQDMYNLSVIIRQTAYVIQYVIRATNITSKI